MYLHFKAKPEMAGIVRKNLVDAIILRQNDVGEFVIYAWLKGREKPIALGAYDTFRQAERRLRLLEKELQND